MKKLAPLAVAILVIGSAPLTTAQKARSRVWTPAVYHGLVVGKSTRGQVLKVLGKPTSTGNVADTYTPYLGYEVSDPVPGTLMVVIPDRIVTEIYLYPKQRLTRQEAIDKFGLDYQIVRYSADDCLDEGGTVPMYENPEGDVEQIEYRQRGLALSVHGAEVDTIMFVAKPFGPTHSRCTGQASQGPA
jgi:hypothetical protein